MTFENIIDIADSVYPDRLIRGAWGNRNGDGELEDVGDTLAIFIVRELQDTFDAEASDTDQLKEAVRAMDSAINELTAVREALRHGKLLM
jgi:hypothetical protein